MSKKLERSLRKLKTMRYQRLTRVGGTISWSWQVGNTSGAVNMEARRISWDSNRWRLSFCSDSLEPGYDDTIQRVMKPLMRLTSSLSLGLKTSSWQARRKSTQSTQRQLACARPSWLLMNKIMKKLRTQNLCRGLPSLETEQSKSNDFIVRRVLYQEKVSTERNPI